MSEFKKTDDNDLLFLNFNNVSKGVISSTTTLKYRNEESYRITNVRLAFQLSNGLFQNGSDEQGQEMQDEQWIEARVQGDIPWVPIGGPYGYTDADPAIEEGTNFLQLLDLDPDEEVTIEVRVNIPSDAATERVATGRFLVSWPDNDEVS